MCWVSLCVYHGSTAWQGRHEAKVTSIVHEDVRVHLHVFLPFL